MKEELYEPVWPAPSMFKNGLDEQISRRVGLLPYKLLPYYVPDQNLYSIYSEAYSAFVFGLNNAGLILLGQLLEITLRLIILLKTGKEKKLTFGQAIDFAKKEGLLIEEDIKILESFNTLVRNPYAHRNLGKILPGVYVPIWGLTLEGEPENWGKNINKTIEGIQEGKYSPSLFRAADDPTVAALVKPKIDEARSLYFAWKIFLEFELLIDCYLQQKDFEKYVKTKGSPFDAVTLINMED